MARGSMWLAAMTATLMRCQPVAPAPTAPVSSSAASAVASAQQPTDASVSEADAGPAAPVDAAPEVVNLGPGEHWSADLKSADGCDDYRTSNNVRVYRDPKGPSRKFSYDGYVYRQIELLREIDGVTRRHCVDVYWPPGDKNSEGKRVTIAKKIGPAWFRLIERTMARLPWRHLQQVERTVIDNRPLLHGVAPFHRGAPDEDARDGHTIWLDEHLFTGVNHWVHGTYGHYWAYHLPVDNVAPDKLRPNHEMFSPVLLHEIGHIVNYNVVNGSASDATCPKCAEMCGDQHTCKQLTPEQRERMCATAYCTGFGHESGTENWAEMYRWYYAGQATRALLQTYFPECFTTLNGGEGPGLNAGRAAPWDEGMTQVSGYRKTKWDSCKGAQCKPY